MRPSTRNILFVLVMTVLLFPFLCSGYHLSFGFDLFLMNHLPGGFFYPTFFENYAPDTVLMIEESNGFSLIDNPKVYFEGDSFVQFNWFYNDFNINSVLDTGAPALQFPFSSLGGFRLQGESPAHHGHGFHFLSKGPVSDRSTLRLSAVYPDMGGPYEWASFMITNPAVQRDDRLYEERRQTLSNFFVDYAYHKELKKSRFMFSFNYFDIKRRFNDFNVFNQTFDETGKLFLFNSSYRKTLNQGFLEITAAFNYLDRSHADAELGRYPQETFDKEKYTFFAGLELKKKAYDLRVSFINETKNMESPYADFYKDLLDNDGEGFLTFGKMGSFTGRALDVVLDVPVRGSLFSKKGSLIAHGDLRFSQTRGDETPRDYHALLFDGVPYQVYMWTGDEDYVHSNLVANLGLHFDLEISRNLSLFSKLWLNYNRVNVDFDFNDLDFLTPAFDVGLLLFKNRNPEIMIAYGHIPYDSREPVSDFLETHRPSGTIFQWDDQNNDLGFQAGEQGNLVGHSGGNSHFLDPDISRPVKHRFLLNISTRLSRNWTLTVKGIYKKIVNNFWVDFDQEYGFYVNQEGYDLYYFDRPYGNYYLTNENFDKDPFYAQLLLHLNGGKKNKWFFSFSFLAHIGMGVTAFGNGAGTNDIGIIHESMANPNSWINGYGRLDGDRAFVGRIFFGFYVLKDLFLGTSLKYRDGNPFAFINASTVHDQVVLYYDTIKAEDERGVKGGPREDYLSEVGVQLNYRFRLFGKNAALSLGFFNILDVGYELSEYVFSGGKRDAVELNIPPSLRLTLTVDF